MGTTGSSAFWDYAYDGLVALQNTGGSAQTGGCMGNQQTMHKIAQVQVGDQQTGGNMGG